MTYCSAGDLVLAFGSHEIVLLADRDRDGAADATVLARAIEAAGAEIDSYLARRYTLPLAAPVPAQIRELACDIARYRLDTVNPREVTTERYRAALKVLDALATGRASLGGAPAGSQAPAAPQSILIDPGQSVFGDDSLAGF